MQHFQLPSLLLNAGGPESMLCVVSVEGGPGTLETVRDSLRAGTPVVLVAGFGRVTDLLAFAVRRTRAALPALPLGHSSHKCAINSCRLSEYVLVQGTTNGYM